MAVVDNILQRMGDYILILEWDVLGVRQYTNRHNETFDIPFGQLIALRIEPGPKAEGTFTVDYNGMLELVSSGLRVRKAFTGPPIIWDKARAKQGVHPPIFWRCHHRV